MISVVIPTLNEAGRLPALIAALTDQPEPHEVIVADGGSADDTARVASDLGVRVIAAPRGRGQQLRAGAEAATGDVLLFLHADSVFPKHGLAAIRRALDARPTAPGGNFQLTFDGDDRFSRWLDGFYAWIRSHGVYYGDSGIFARRAIYEELGGIRPLALMEDFDFTRRLEKRGPTVCIDAPALVTSSRRFRGRHPATIVCGWLWIHALYFLGAPAEKLARLYDSARRRQRPVV